MDTCFSNSSYDALSHPPTDLTHEYDPRWYRNPPPPKHGSLQVTMPVYGTVDNEVVNKYNIRYTVWGDRGPWVLFLHGVPTNRSQYIAIQKRLSPFCKTIAIDMLGMGESSMPLKYGEYYSPELEDNEHLLSGDFWDWKFDSIYILQLVEEVMGNEKFFFVADDWGGGILSHFVSRYNNMTYGNIWINPIAFDGYPVSEIQAFGRASRLDDKEFISGMSSADQTMTQILKTMTYDPNKWNQYNLRDVMKTYVDVDYHRNEYEDGEDASSLTLRPHPLPLRVLSDRSSILSPSLLLPFHEKKNTRGVLYTNITKPCKIIWGKQDNMMPERQAWRFVHVLKNAEVTVDYIDNAGHFSGLDQPDSVSESIIGFILSKPKWRKMIPDVFLGFGGDGRIYKGDEKEVIKAYREIYNIPKQ